MQKIIVILGQTAVGKTNLSIHLAQQFSGEVISADSRQVYQGLDIGTAKVTAAEMQDIPHHLIDVADPENTFTVAEFRELADQAITEITNRDHLPLVVGGSGFYIQALIDDIPLADVSPNEDLRAELATKTSVELFEQLQTLDSARAKTIDSKNPRRLIRAIEVATALGQVPLAPESPAMRYDALLVGLERNPSELQQRIHTRNTQRIENDSLIDEVKNLHKNGLSWGRLDALGLEYRYVSQFIREEIETKEELITILNQKTWQFAKRQKTWWQRDSRIHWFHPEKNYQEITDLVKNFLDKN